MDDDDAGANSQRLATLERPRRFANAREGEREREMQGALSGDQKYEVESDDTNDQCLHVCQ